jgi:cytidyltransferase-like protein
VRVLTIGTFDLLHCGHIRLFRRAALFGELHVGVNSDRFVEAYKERPTADAFEVRCERVAAVRSVYEVHENDGPGVDLIRALMPDVLAIGSDWLDRPYLEQIGTTVEELVALDVSVLFLPRTPGISTTQLRAAA